MGGVFAEGIDLKGSRLIGAAVVGTGVPQISPRGDALTRIYETMYGSGYDYAYLYPGLCRVYQAAGRVIRRESDRGAVLLIDARWCEPRHEALLPKHWRVKTVRDPDALQISLRAFWMEEDASSDDIVLPHHQAVQVKAPDFKPGPEDQAQAEHPYAAQDD